MIIALALIIAFAWFAYMAAQAEDGYQDQDGYHSGTAPTTICDNPYHI